ncbi:MAG: hypothetical protein HY904_13965 [Deltaproteobacteria bacterium]|nr:hypothetical protein [Deltaproteobacteria bacterium]
MATLGSLLNVYALPTGRRIVALRAVREIAAAMGLTVLVSFLDAAIAHDEQTRTVELDWIRQKRQPTANPGEAVVVDTELDRVLGGIHAMLTGVVEGALPGQPVEEARTLLTVLFPAGLAGLTQGTHVDEATAVQAVMRDVRKPEHATRIQALRLGASLDRVDQLATRMTGILSAAAKSPTLQYSTVTDSQQKGLSHLRETVARVLGLHPSDSQADTQARARLLEGVLRQGEAFAEAFKRRRGGVDVNPDTGEPTEDVVG